MILRKYIEEDLKKLNHLYLNSVAGPDPKVPVYYSKLAVLELCGWVEESFDLIARRAVKGKLKVEKFTKLRDNAIKKTHGFHYDNHFLAMLTNVGGLEMCEHLHMHLDATGSHAVLTGELNAISEQRGRAAHTNLANTRATFDAPSVTLGRLTRMYPVLREMYGWFCE